MWRGETQRHLSSPWPGLKKWQWLELATLVPLKVGSDAAHRSRSVSPTQHGTLGSGRSSDKGPSWSSRSLGARCRNSIASCPEEQPHVGNYRLLRTIGKGNFAKVKLARHILTGREVSDRVGVALSQVLQHWCFVGGGAPWAWPSFSFVTSGKPCLSRGQIRTSHIFPEQPK